MPKLLKGGFPFNSSSEEIAQNAPIYKRNMIIILGILLIILIVFIVKFGFGRGLLYFVGGIFLIAIIVAIVAIPIPIILLNYRVLQDKDDI